jgi:hypothetical protein
MTFLEAGQCFYSKLLKEKDTKRPIDVQEQSNWASEYLKPVGPDLREAEQRFLLLFLEKEEYF